MNHFFYTSSLARAPCIVTRIIFRPPVDAQKSGNEQNGQFFASYWFLKIMRFSFWYSTRVWRLYAISEAVFCSNVYAMKCTH